MLWTAQGFYHIIRLLFYLLMADHISLFNIGIFFITAIKTTPSINVNNIYKIARTAFSSLAACRFPASMLFLKPNIPKPIISVKHCMASIKSPFKSISFSKIRHAGTITHNGKIAVRLYFRASFLSLWLFMFLIRVNFLHQPLPGENMKCYKAGTWCRLRWTFIMLWQMGFICVDFLMRCKNW